ncbi:Gfo/Idh/MocA family oxidoreductase [Frondihabitans cladoniiphilus]|uniref:Inositol 2-dehydrogenase n=1 Tax=Frondihabitans cladoniiphilus TaxID=715785 RepID=A0ABP8VRU6_9MICO
MSLTSPVRFALLGAGFIGSAHAVNLAAHPAVDFAVVFDVDLPRATALAAKYGAVATDDLEAVFGDPSIDAVLIASSTDTHAEHLGNAARAGKAIFCEKPIDLDLARATEAVRVVEESGVPAMIDFNRRFDRDYASLQAQVRAGDIGTVELVHLTSRGPSMPPLEYLAVSGGQMRDQAVHFFDLLTWITGEKPVEVFAAGSALAEPRLTEIGDVDTSVVTVRLESGALCQIDCTRRIGYGYDERIEVVGSLGMIEARRQRNGSVSKYVGSTIVEDGLHAGWFERLRDSYAASLGAFVSALVEERTPSPSLADGLRAQALADAATESLSVRRPIMVTAVEV